MGSWQIATALVGWVSVAPAFWMAESRVRAPIVDMWFSLHPSAVALVAVAAVPAR